jgi:hypothetical protein
LANTLAYIVAHGYSTESEDLREKAWRWIPHSKDSWSSIAGSAVEKFYPMGSHQSHYRNLHKSKDQSSAASWKSWCSPKWSVHVKSQQSQSAAVSDLGNELCQFRETACELARARKLAGCQNQVGSG